MAKGDDTAGALSRTQRHLYAAGHFGISFMGYVITQWVMKFYFPNSPTATTLVPVALAPWIMGLGRITDGINDPVIGYLTDSIRTRWGRRKPFMIVGLPILCLLFVLLWYPPAREEAVVNFWYAALLLVVFFAAFTAYVGPYVAMLAEVTRSEDERLKLSALQGIYNVLGLVAAGFVTGEALKRGMSYQGMALLVTIVSAAAFVLPLFGPRDDPSRVEGQERLPFIRSVSLTLGSRPFRLYVFPQLLFYMGLLIIVAGLPYISETLLSQPEGEAGTLTGISLLVGAACVPLILKRADRRGSKEAYLFSLRWFAITAPLLAVLRFVGAYSWGIWVARALVILPGAAIGGLFALPYAILALITDHDRQRTGMDRQGMFFCMQGMVLKIAFSGAPMIVVGLLALLPQHQQTVLTLIGPLAGVLALAAYGIFRRFPDEELRAAIDEAGQPAANGGELAQGTEAQA